MCPVPGMGQQAHEGMVGKAGTNGYRNAMGGEKRTLNGKKGGVGVCGGR